LSGVSKGVETARVAEAPELTGIAEGVETAGVTAGTRGVELIARHLVEGLRSSARPT
jgi:hypothetical protein